MATVMTAVVPTGMGEGMMMQVQTASGPMQVQIPPGMKEGMQFQFGVAAPAVQPTAAVPMAASPVQPMAAVPMAATPVVQVASAGPVGGVNAPPGVPPGGYYKMEKYCGPVTWCIGCFVFACVCCCPCDDREVYIAPNGAKYTRNGAAVSDCC